MSIQTFMYFYFHRAMFSTTTVSLTASSTYGFFKFKSWCSQNVTGLTSLSSGP